MTKPIQIKDEVFKKLNLVKNGLELSWSDYLLRLFINSDKMILVEHNLVKADERIAELEAQLTKRKL